MRCANSAPTSGKILGIVLALVAVAAIVGTILFQREKMPETSPVSRGEKLARQAGCFACHGRGDGEARFNLRDNNGRWVTKANPTLWDNGVTETKVILDWIKHGVPADQAARHKKLFIQMPAYEGRLKPSEMEDVAAWVLAEGLKYTQTPIALKEKSPALPTGTVTPEQLLLAGDRLSRKFGCYQCHGELGQGGVANPDSLKGYIPGFFGKDFRILTANNDRAEILHWIDHGRGRAIESGLLGGVARRYFAGQAIKMPGYRDQLAPAEKELLADFLLLLERKGPLTAPDLERLVTSLDAEASN